MSRRRERVFLPGWWRFWAPGPQWSSTARQRIGVPAPTEPGDWHLWESELRQGDTMTGPDLTATYEGSALQPGPADRPSFADELTEQLARDAIENTAPADKAVHPDTEGISMVNPNSRTSAGSDYLAGADMTATFASNPTPAHRPAGLPRFAQELREQLARDNTPAAPGTSTKPAVNQQASPAPTGTPPGRPGPGPVREQQASSPPRPVPAAPEAATPWHYWVEFLDSSGGGRCEVRRATPITSGQDMESVSRMIAKQIGHPIIAVSKYSVLDSPSATHTPPGARSGGPVSPAQHDPTPWHYWVAFRYGATGGGACEVRREHRVQSGADIAALGGVIAQQFGQPVRVTAHTLLHGPAEPAGQRT